MVSSAIRRSCGFALLFVVVLFSGCGNLQKSEEQAPDNGGSSKPAAATSSQPNTTSTQSKKYNIRQTFPDPALAACVAHHFGQDVDSDITQEQVNGYDAIDSFDYPHPENTRCSTIGQIKSLKGIEIFTNVYQLELNNASLVDDITPVANLKKLELLNIVGTNVKNIDFLLEKKGLSRITIPNDLVLSPDFMRVSGLEIDRCIDKTTNNCSVVKSSDYYLP
ncbi:MAG: hypothetical protein LBI63_00500 [Candidatus Ancillula sp.]|jgi:hypothetical protein|nr:hypothetical protein [Candidatus Ancillula sp.]